MTLYILLQLLTIVMEEEQDCRVSGQEWKNELPLRIIIP